MFHLSIFSLYYYFLVVIIIVSLFHHNNNFVFALSSSSKSKSISSLIIDVIEEEHQEGKGKKRRQQRRRALIPTWDGCYNDLNTINNNQNNNNNNNNFLFNLQNITLRHHRIATNRRLNDNNNNTFTSIDSTTYIPYGVHTRSSSIQDNNNNNNNDDIVTAWHGLTDNGFAKIIQLHQSNDNNDNDNIILSGFFTTKHETYSLSTLHNGTQIVHAMSWKDRAYDEPQIEIPFLQKRKHERKLQKQQQKHNNNNTTIKKIDVIIPKEYSLLSSMESLRNNFQKARHSSRNLQIRSIDVLVVVTTEAACVVAGLDRTCTNPTNVPIRTKIEEAVETTTDAMQGVNIPYEIKVVRIEITDIFHGLDISDAHKQSQTDPTILQWSEQYDADLVMLIIDPEDSKVVINGQLQEAAGTVLPETEFSAMNSNYFPIRFAYNIGRNIGCRQQREYFTNSDRVPPNDYNYAYEYYIENEISYYRTIMGLRCQEEPFDDCTLYPFFSSRYHQVYNDQLQTNVNLGGPINDNARYIHSYGQRTASRRELCFSKYNTVYVQSKGLIQMNQLQIGDYIQTNNGYSRVYSFFHLDHNIDATFIQIYTNNNNIPIEISHNHILFIQDNNNNSNNKKVAIRAKDVIVGDKLFTITVAGTTTTTDVVTRIGTVKRHGVYAPITVSGELIVSNILVSSYAAIFDSYSIQLQIYGAHTLLSTQRLLCSLFYNCIDETYTNGIADSIYTITMIAFHIQQKCNYLIQIILSMMMVPFLLTTYFVEQILILFFSSENNNRMMIFGTGCIMMLFMPLVLLCHRSITRKRAKKEKSSIDLLSF